jgi:F-type H+-transporting ATPase subunit b
MNTIIEAFHVDVTLLIAQAINFAIVFAVLYFFVLKPLTKIMNDRTKKIEKSLEDAKKIDDKLVKTEEDYKQAMAEARIEASGLIEKANQYAEKKKQEAVEKARAEIGQVINDEKAQILQEKARILKEIRAEVADLVSLSVAKVLEEKVDSKTDKEIIKKALKK